MDAKLAIFYEITKKMYTFVTRNNVHKTFRKKWVLYQSKKLPITMEKDDGCNSFHANNYYSFHFVT